MTAVTTRLIMSPSTATSKSAQAGTVAAVIAAAVTEEAVTAAVTRSITGKAVTLLESR